MKITRITKRLSALALCAVLAVGSLAVSAGAAQSTTVTAQISPNIDVVVDGVERTFYNVSGTEVHPIVYNGTTYLPVRAIGELMGKNVNWDQSTLTASLTSPRTTGATVGTPDTSAVTKNVTVGLHPEYTILVDGVERTFTNVNGTVVYPMAYNGSIYLPLRAIGNLMGKTVAWDGATSTATLSGGNEITDADSFNQTGGNTGSTGNTGTTTGTITADRAKEIALKDAGLTAGQVTFIRAHLDWDDGRRVYDVEFYNSANYTEYDYEIDASTGAILSKDFDAEYYTQPGTGGTGAAITADRAKEIALNHAGVSASSATFVYAKLDWDDGRLQYDVEFYSGSTEYDYEIDANTGAILSYDHDWDNTTQTIPAGSNLISADRAKEIALGRAPSGATVVKCELERDDGRYLYEIEMRSGRTEYSCDVDASTGAIYDWDVDYD